MGFTLGVLVTVTTGGGGGGAEIRVTKTMKALRKDRLLRPPSGVPETAK
jgi:Fe2+ transport system protein FeoA